MNDRPPADPWDTDELRDFCRRILVAFPGAKITLREREPPKPLTPPPNR